MHPARYRAQLALPFLLTVVAACGDEPAKGGTKTPIDALPWVAGPNPIYNGQSGVVFTVLPANAGATPTGAVQVTGTVDSLLTLTSASGTSWTCSASGGSYTCQHPGPMGAAATLPAIALTVTTPIPGSGPHAGVNVCATISTPGDANASNNSRCASVDLLERDDVYDLVLTKSTLNNTTPSAGAPLTYALVVQNFGPDAVADAITVTDTLPASLTLDGVGPPLGGAWTCSTAGQSLTCTRVPGMVLYQMETLLVYATVADTAEGTIENCAHLTAAQDTNGANNDDCHAAEVPAPAPFDLDILKTVWTPYSGGATVGYQIMLQNHGPNPTNGLVKVVDVLPPGTSLLGYSGSILWSCSTAGSTLTCLLPTSVPVNGWVILGLTLSVAPGTAEPFLNCIDIVAPGDTDPTNNRSCTDSSPQTDLVVTKQLIGGVTYGGTATYEVTITNAGSTPIPWNINMVDPLPNGVSRSGMPLVLSGSWACSPGFYWSIVCGYTGPLPAPVGVLGVIRYTVNVPSAADLAAQGVTGTLINCATAQPTGPDATPDDNTDCVGVPIPPLYELVAASAVALEPRAGGRMRYVVQVSNTGVDAPPEAVSTTLDLPADVDFLGTPSSAWRCSSATQGASRVTCTYVELAAPGELEPLEIDLWVASTATPDSTFELCTTAWPTDANAADSTSCTEHTIRSSPACSGHFIAAAPMLYDVEVQSALLGAAPTLEPFLADTSGAPLASGEATLAGDGFQHYASLVVASVGTSAQRSAGKPVRGVAQGSVDWTGSGSSAVIRSYVGADAQTGHDGLRFDFTTPVRAAFVRTDGVDVPLWLSVYDQNDALAEVFLVEPGQGVVGVDNHCGGTIGALRLEPGQDPLAPGGTDEWGVRRVGWVAP